MGTGSVIPPLAPCPDACVPPPIPTHPILLENYQLFFMVQAPHAYTVIEIGVFCSETGKEKL